MNERKEHQPSSISKGLSVKGKFLKKYGRFEKKIRVKLYRILMVVTLTVRFYHCTKEGHTRNMCPKRLNNHGGKDNGNVAIVQDNYESFDIPVVSNSDSSKERIMDPV